MRSEVRASPEAEHTVWWLLLCRAVEQRVRAALAAREGEPVGEIVGTEKRGFALMTVVRWEPGFNCTAVGTKLFAAPPALHEAARLAQQRLYSIAAALLRHRTEGEPVPRIASGKLDKAICVAAQDMRGVIDALRAAIDAARRDGGEGA